MYATAHVMGSKLLKKKLPKCRCKRLILIAHDLCFFNAACISMFDMSLSLTEFGYVIKYFVFNMALTHNLIFCYKIVFGI